MAFGDKAAGLPQRLVSTDKGYSILWNTPGYAGHIDDTPGRQVKKPGDVTFSLPPAPRQYNITSSSDR